MESQMPRNEAPDVSVDMHLRDGILAAAQGPILIRRTLRHPGVTPCCRNFPSDPAMQKQGKI